MTPRTANGAGHSDDDVKVAQKDQLRLQDRVPGLANTHGPFTDAEPVQACIQGTGSPCGRSAVE